MYLPAFSSRLTSTRSISTASQATNGLPGSMCTASGRSPSAPWAALGRLGRAADDLVDRAMVFNRLCDVCDVFNVDSHYGPQARQIP